MTIKTTKARELGEAKLALSGLTPADAKILAIDCLSAQQTARLSTTFKPLCSLRLNYLDHQGRPLTDWPGGRPFYRLRYLEIATDFNTLTNEKPPRYAQEPNTAPVIYYPANQDWEPIVQTPSYPLIITEGELKAAKACKEGFPTLGVGGVYNWRARKLGLTWLSSLDLVDWRRRSVYICFDSDYKTNPNVCYALRELAEALNQHGAFVYVVTLPQLPEEEKVGLDDFLVQNGPTAGDQFQDLLTNAVPLGLTAPLWELNDHYTYVQNPGMIIDQNSYAKINPGAFKDHLKAPMVYQEQQLKADGMISYKAVSAAGHWLKWPLRSEVIKLTYEPGQLKFIAEDPPRFNLWPGWGLEPKKGNLDPFFKLVDYLFTDAEPASKMWFLRWCAYPLQYPGVKMFSSVVVHGIRHGTGKSLLGYTLGRIYGKNFTEISQVDLHNSFNEWAEGKQFIMGDDVTGSDKRAEADLLKKLITQQELRVNMKYIPSYVVPDCINYYFTANHPDSFFLEDDDRRFFIHEVTVSPLPEEFYVQYTLWLNSGAAAVFDYLLHLNLSDFNPAAPAFKTLAKERMIVNLQSDLASWVRALLSTPDNVLRVGDMTIERDLFTSKELLQLYDPIGRTNVTANGLGRELARAGVLQVCGGHPVRLVDGSQARYYVIKSRDRWKTATSTQVTDHLNGWTKKQNVVKQVKY